MYIKILELMVWCKKHHKNPDNTEIYRMYNNGLVRHKFESYLCLKVSSLRAFSVKKEIDDELKNIGKKWLDILHEFLNDTEYQKEKEEQENELIKMRDYFQKMEAKNVKFYD